jgi:hypothetical protein
MTSNKGQFKAGHAKAGGRTKGSKNKATAKIKERVQSFIDDNFDSMQEDLKQLEPLERVKVYLKLMEFVLPKQKALDIEHSEYKGIPLIHWVENDANTHNVQFTKTGVEPITSEAELTRLEELGEYD